MKEYWTETYTDIYPGITFKIDKINPIKLINLATENIEFDKMSLDRKDSFIKNCLLNVKWTKDESNYFPLIDKDDNPHLAELQSCPEIAFDIMYVMRRDVLLPVFTASKTYQDLTSERKVPKA